MPLGTQVEQGQEAEPLLQEKPKKTLAAALGIDTGAGSSDRQEHRHIHAAGTDHVFAHESRVGHGPTHKHDHTHAPGTDQTHAHAPSVGQEQSQAHAPGTVDHAPAQASSDRHDHGHDVPLSYPQVSSQQAASPSYQAPTASAAVLPDSSLQTITTPLNIPGMPPITVSATMPPITTHTHTNQDHPHSSSNPYALPASSQHAHHPVTPGAFIPSAVPPTSSGFYQPYQQQQLPPIQNLTLFNPVANSTPVSSGGTQEAGNFVRMYDPTAHHQQQKPLENPN